MAGYSNGWTAEGGSVLFTNVRILDAKAERKRTETAPLAERSEASLEHEPDHHKPDHDDVDET